MPVNKAPPHPSPGGWIVLGLLVQDSPQSGYDLASRATRGISHFWPITKAQIYAELPRLEALGYARGEDVAQIGAPDKRMYLPTTAGRAEFKAWLKTASLGTPKLRHPLLLQLWFGAQTEPDHLLALCDKHEFLLSQERDRFQGLLDKLAGRHRREISDSLSRKHRLMAVRHGLLRVSAELEWLAEVRALLSEQKESARRSH